jgi:ribose 1,5-bisphosphokinase
MTPSEGAPSSPIGPGRLFLIVGPSGAGKDTLINLVRAALRADTAIVFARRTVTRPASGFEAHDSMSEDAFEEAARGGAFALTWSAHGLRYGVSARIDDDIRAGRTVVLNGSRSVCDLARRRYARVTIVLVTAPPAILAARLAARQRVSDGRIDERLSRAPAVWPDVTITNDGSPEGAAAQLVVVLKDRSSAGCHAGPSA